MKRLRFGLDLDEVLYDWHSAAAFLLSEWAGHRIDMKELFPSRVSSFDNKVGAGADQWLWSEGVKRGLFRHGHVRRGAISFVNELDTLVDIVIITHRPRQARQDTYDWLSFHRIPAREVHLLDKEEPKWQVEVDCLLDDKIQNVVDFVNNSTIDKTGLIWDREFNRDVGNIFEQNSGIGWLRRAVMIQRMSSWQEVLNWTRRRTGVDTLASTKS